MVSNLKATILIRRNSKLCLDELDISPEKDFFLKIQVLVPAATVDTFY